ncbi:MAG: LysR family transcriptional regulator [Flavonifractor plautii]
MSRAAERLYISQQSLSNHISNMEKELDVKLFTRSPKLSLTYAGGFAGGDRHPDPGLTQPVSGQGRGHQPALHGPAAPGDLPYLRPGPAAGHTAEISGGVPHGGIFPV